MVAFIAVRVDRFFKDRSVASDTQQSSSAPPLVDTIQAAPVGAVQRLSLPGQTAAWHSSTIYARVNGYVGKWFVDIGDQVHKGEVMAQIETPDLDAQLAGARAGLQAAEAQVLVRRSQAEFAKSTYERLAGLAQRGRFRAGTRAEAFGLRQRGGQLEVRGGGGCVGSGARQPVRRPVGVQNR